MTKVKPVDGVPAGYWEWFRKDGVRMRSGHFKDGEQGYGPSGLTQPNGCG